MQDSQGFTVLEALTVTAIVSVLMAVSVPALHSLVQSATMTERVNGFVHALHSARQAANTRGVSVVVCASDGAGRCLDELDWQRGWVVFADIVAGNGRQPDADDLVLAMGQRKTTLRVTANRTAFRFTPFTRRDTNGSVSFCDERGPGFARLVVISPTGRPRLASSAETNRRVRC